MSALPPITVSSLDADRLYELIDTLPAAAFPGAATLRAELDRATLLEPEDMPADVVTMRSRVRFEIAGSGQTFELTLCYPKDLNGSAEQISITAPVGSALLGLGIGQQITWPAPGGGTTSVKILDVVYQPERAGDLGR
ncbi:nucleoside diphosphate kinase regulator [Jeongeupia sp. HS-3]|uniref:nucleoside diphosphate kinase regulator n=1 Tax=Jeongeupia sp. HS-3 TaxID=1009682 RepID=UPI0018A44154|nr:nucleoside diphosphate kinase regulator [Jeongeupia sp. HS-3]BCL76334.1 nucleoside diphosphate kinase regulator [Jeongeupia sp. HS-3]